LITFVIKIFLMSNIIPTMVRLPEELKMRVDEVAFSRKRLKMSDYKINSVLVEAIKIGLQYLETNVIKIENSGSVPVERIDEV